MVHVSYDGTAARMIYHSDGGRQVRRFERFEGFERFGGSEVRKVLNLENPGNATNRT
jgi:hypothetical protein